MPSLSNYQWCSELTHLNPACCLCPWTSAEAVEEQTERLEQWSQALTEKVEKLDRIVYRLWRDLKALVNEEYHRKQAE